MPNYVSLSTATLALAQADRVLVIGIPGGGKTSLSCKVRDELNLEYYSLDRDVWWSSGWNVRSLGEQRARIDGFVLAERWVIEGNGIKTLDLRLPLADIVLWVSVSRVTALVGIAIRTVCYFGKVRPEMAHGCLERVPSIGFLKKVWNFERDRVPHIESSIERFSPCVPVVRLRTFDEMNLLISGAAKLVGCRQKFRSLP